MIYHIAHLSDWEAAVVGGEYVVASLANEGFIHLSTRQQVLRTAGRYYVGVVDLVLLEVNPDLLDPALFRFEPSTNDELFPHLYGPLPLAAVVSTNLFPAQPDGSFVWPAALDS